MWEFWIDRGGTFTDVVGTSEQGELRMSKVLSESSCYADAPSYGIRQVLGIAEGQLIPEGLISSVKMGTTITTNALLEKKGEPTLLLQTKGFGDSLRIRSQHRPDIFALRVEMPQPLFAGVAEVNERIAADGTIVQSLDELATREILRQWVSKGVTSCAISLLHGYKYPNHEIKVGKLAKECGFTAISLSHEVSPIQKYIPRSDTTLVDAYLNPAIQSYIQGFQKNLGGNHYRIPVQFMQSSGGLISGHEFRGKNSILSGPAGGVIGSVKAAEKSGFEAVIGFDMGGTSTDVCHYHGKLEKTIDSLIDGINLQTPMVAIHTVAAGGGSRLKYEQGRYQVGPESAGAAPGPVCYGLNGHLAITDCNLFLGRLVIEAFPAVFGTEGNQELFVESTNSALTRLNQRINDGRSVEDMAEAYLKIAVSNMAHAVRKISTEKGIAIDQHVLCSLGSAAGQVVCLMAEELGMNKIMIHPLAGLLSAFGIGQASQIIDHAVSVDVGLHQLTQGLLDDLMEQTRETQESTLAAKDSSRYQQKTILGLQLEGTQSIVEIETASVAGLEEKFLDKFEQMFAYRPKTPKIRMVLLRMEWETTEESTSKIPLEVGDMPDLPEEQKLYSHGKWQTAKIYTRQSMLGQTIMGPAIIVESTGTNVVEFGWQAELDEQNTILLTRLTKHTPKSLSATKPTDPFKLELFGNLFQQIAERMGVGLQRTAVSVNIRERLDFSCAIFDSKGDLVANAPHIPVHLGSMSACVKDLITQHQEQMQDGDSFLHNDPYHGGTHLPDLTVVTPVYLNGSAPVAFVASRGHHSDVGGITPGSMPSFSTSIDEEGVLVRHEKIATKGQMDEELLTQLFSGSAHPARNVATNIADLQAQIVANNTGLKELKSACDQHSSAVILHYMEAIQANAAETAQELFSSLQEGECLMEADGGIRVQCRIEVSREKNSIVFDFSGSSLPHPGNLNAPAAVVRAATLYCLRCMLGKPIPLNDGILRAVRIHVPSPSVLSPHYPQAVVAGNVEISQLVVDAILGATGFLAASQGTMNNLSFGNDRFQYYETIAGGMGAGPQGNGCSGIQTHMTNSRLTDPEVIEAHYPVRIESFAYQSGSGGQGIYSGGDGLRREIKFLEAMTVNLISNRRQTAAAGLAGGGSGQSGSNVMIKPTGERQQLAGCDSFAVEPGDILSITTPGGGGYGEITSIKETDLERPSL